MFENYCHRLTQIDGKFIPNIDRHNRANLMRRDLSKWVREIQIAPRTANYDAQFILYIVPISAKTAQLSEQAPPSCTRYHTKCSIFIPPLLSQRQKISKTDFHYRYNFVILKLNQWKNTHILKMPFNQVCIEYLVI